MAITPEYRKINTRKPHKCAYCEEIIPPGTAQFLEFKGPTYDTSGEQDGIEFYREWIHQSCLDKIMADCELTDPLPF